MKNKNPDQPKRDYTPPDFSTQGVFEVNAATCGKCTSGSTQGGFPCARIKKTS